MHSPSPWSPQPDRPVAVVGAGMAGARCAGMLRDAGIAVQVVDKSRGPGGRLATRRGTWVDGEGREQAVAWDHGAPGFEAQAPDFVAWLQAQSAQGRARCERPRIAGQGEGPARWRGWPTQPTLCQVLLEGVPTRWCCSVQGLARGAEGWTLHTDAGPLGPFAAVVLALPPAQAAPLLALHRDDWARAAALVPMQPCWTLMGVSDAVPEAGADTVWLPPSGPIERLTRQPTAGPDDGPAAWVAHARAGWSREHLEAEASVVGTALQAAVDEVLGRALRWRHATAHRWRYAQPALPPRDDWGGARWDPGLRLGLCGDHLAGAGVEGAWRSGGVLALLAQQRSPVHHAPPPRGRADGAVSSLPAPQ